MAAVVVIKIINDNFIQRITIIRSANADNYLKKMIVQPFFKWRINYLKLNFKLER